MLYSFRGKIIFFIFMVLAATTALTMYFTYRDVGHAITKKIESSMQNIYKLVELNIQGTYKNLQQDKINKIIQDKKELKVISNGVSSVFKEYLDLSQQGLITTDTAQQKTLNWLKRFNGIRKNVSCFVFEKNGQIISHKGMSLHGTFISNLKDMKGRNIVNVVFKNAFSFGGDYAVFNWAAHGPNDKSRSNNKQVGYFIPFHNWDWIICVTVKIGDLEAEFQTKLDQMIKVLEKNFDKLQIADTGSAFLFNDNKKILIPPKSDKNLDFGSAVNTLTGDLLVDDLIVASHSAIDTFKYILKSDKDKRLMVTTVKFFKLLKWHIAFTVPVKEINHPARVLVIHQLFVIAAIFIISLIITFFLVSKITKPLKTLSLYAKKIPYHDFTVIDEQKSPIQELPEKYKDEIGELAQSFIFMKDELTNNIMKLMETTAAKERIQGELNVATKIQMGMLPKIFPPFPDHNEFDLFAMLEPAKEVGGDLYDFFFIDDDHLCFTVGDVSDKGVPAALFMVITKTLIKTIAQNKRGPAETMTELNGILCSENPNTMFVTLFIGILNIRTGEIKYSNGGHNPPIVINKKEVYYKKGISGPVVGVIENIEYKELSLKLQSEDLFFLYTDGVTEAKDLDEVMFSDNRLLQEIKAVRGRGVEDTVKKIMSKVKEHAGQAPQSDDIAMMMIQFNGH